MPPELATAMDLGNESALHNGRQVDVWCTGVLLFALLTGRLPFRHLPSPNERPAGGRKTAQRHLSRQWRAKTELAAIQSGGYRRVATMYPRSPIVDCGFHIGASSNCCCVMDGTMALGLEQVHNSALDLCRCAPVADGDASSGPGGAPESARREGAPVGAGTRSGHDLGQRRAPQIEHVTTGRPPIRLASPVQGGGLG
jgi:serine/threonine protein kinase